MAGPNFPLRRVDCPIQRAVALSSAYPSLAARFGTYAEGHAEREMGETRIHNSISWSENRSVRPGR